MQATGTQRHGDSVHWNRRPSPDCLPKETAPCLATALRCSSRLQHSLRLSVFAVCLSTNPY